jgi:hypothetical protein
MNNTGWQIIDTGESIPTKTYNNQGEIIKVNESKNKIYHVTGPNCDILLTASNILQTYLSENSDFLCILATKAYDIEEGLQDHFDPNNFIIIYPLCLRKAREARCGEIFWKYIIG